MVSYRELVSGFRGLGLNPDRPIIAHASFRSFGEVRGGPEVLLGALLSVAPRLMMPTHTYKTMLIPEDGPENNGMHYGSGHSLNAMAEFFSQDMPADSLMGILPETLRRHPQAHRSSHPILSFAGVGVDSLLDRQTLADPFGLISAAVEEDGWVILMGVDHTVNTSLHLAEKLAGRRQFVRWALTAQGSRECPGFPGCSLGFEKAASLLAPITRHAMIGKSPVRALPLPGMIETVQNIIAADPFALLCDDPACERCTAVRETAQTAG